MKVKINLTQKSLSTWQKMVNDDTLYAVSRNVCYVFKILICKTKASEPLTRQCLKSAGSWPSPSSQPTRKKKKGTRQDAMRGKLSRKKNVENACAHSEVYWIKLHTRFSMNKGWKQNTTYNIQLHEYGDLYRCSSSYNGDSPRRRSQS